MTEGFACFPAGSDCDVGGLTLPIEAYGHDDGCSVTGGYVYRGTASPVLTGGYLFADFCTGRIWMLRNAGDAGWQRTELLDTGHYISSFGEDEAGELYLTDLAQGTVYRLVADAAYPEPVITALDPGHAIAGSDALTLIVYGAGFNGASSVLWNGEPRPTTLLGTTRVSIAVSAADIAAPANVTITVVNPEPGGGESNPATFQSALTNPDLAAFERVWSRTDRLVAELAASRTWM